MAMTPERFYLRRTNSVDNVWILGHRDQWHLVWQGKTTGYAKKVYKTVSGAATAAERHAQAHPKDGITVLSTDGDRPVYGPIFGTSDPSPSSK